MPGIPRTPFVSLLVLLLLLSSHFVFASAFSGVERGDKVILIKPLDDGVTYVVHTPVGIEVWRDRDLHYFAAYEEICVVLKSYGTEVLIYVPIMDSKYWFVVEQTLH